ncbi:Protein CBR-THOC-1 [Caenorhabditis briggsae]|uniref:Protein CBR-THOC-1 n=1 Tax=Caenorhabditis briggsae TaxID=6238 RepID=A8WK85_CAEBR|nr:Protein CBR-THOC-1 [Caenorhabditis briggsae]CAP20878.3 Protein CBR-THOC-1 [Caenorhabditis briggsae]
MEEAIANRNFDDLRELFKAEKKTVKDDEFVIVKIDGLLKKRGYRVMEVPSEQKEEFARLHFNFVMNCTKLGYCSKSTPILTLQDILEVSSIEECKHLFGLVEENMNEFKQVKWLEMDQNLLPGFIETYQNIILRLCNDLLRRLSRTAETSFCGRIMFFLSRFLPLTEKSGVNFMGHFNTLNITTFEENEPTAESLLAATSSHHAATPSGATPGAEGEDMETGEIEEEAAKEIIVTPEMYRQFWSLQKFMSNPNLLYEKEKFVVFKKDLTAVLSLMTANKLEKFAAEDESEVAESRKKINNDVFFTKYLTSPKLLALQLNDSSFRRNFLIQTIIIFQYLNAESRFKPPAKPQNPYFQWKIGHFLLKIGHFQSKIGHFHLKIPQNSPQNPIFSRKMVLNEEQSKFVHDYEDKCYRLLSDTMPRGTAFVAGLKRIMQRETEWNQWKNSNCPDLSEKADKGAMQMYKKRQRVPFNPNNLDLGTPELTKLWTYEPDVLKACKSDKRKFIPTLADFIRDPLDEMDPEQQVEEQYKSINEVSFQWRAARLLMHKAPGYVSKTEPKADPTTNMPDHVQRRKNHRRIQVWNRGTREKRRRETSRVGREKRGGGEEEGGGIAEAEVGYQYEEYHDRCLLAEPLHGPIAHRRKSPSTGDGFVEILEKIGKIGGNRRGRAPEDVVIVLQRRSRPLLSNSQRVGGAKRDKWAEPVEPAHRRFGCDRGGDGDDEVFQKIHETST